MFLYSGDNEHIKEVVFEANNLQILDYISMHIRIYEPFDMSNSPIGFIFNNYKDFMINTPIEIEVYYPRYKRSKALGYYTKSKPRTIHINGYKKIELQNFVSLLYHESGHVFDGANPEYKINHGNNKSKGKDGTFQYSLNRFIKNWYISIGRSLPVKKKVSPWYVRLFRWIF